MNNTPEPKNTIVTMSSFETHSEFRQWLLEYAKNPNSQYKVYLSVWEYGATFYPNINREFLDDLYVNLVKTIKTNSSQRCIVYSYEGSILHEFSLETLQESWGRFI